MPLANAGALRTELWPARPLLPLPPRQLLLLLLGLLVLGAEGEPDQGLLQACELGPRDGNSVLRLVDGVPVLRAAVTDAHFVFHHIPKTGGTTFQAAVSRGELAHDWKGCRGATWDKYSGHFKDNFPGIVEQATSGDCNVICYELNAGQIGHERAMCHLMNEGFLAMTLLREPTSHVMSMITHHLARNEYSSVAEKLFNITCKSAAHNTYMCENPQVAHLSPRADATHAVELLRDNYFFFGLTEHMLASFCLLAFQLGDTYTGPFTKRRCACAATRVSHESHINVARQPTSFTAREVSAIINLTDVDRQLYDAMRKEFYRRLGVVEREWGIQMMCS
mmetsp:Transcript_6344/g.21356  ORF Transcript_6344/g.21356 Transcript_6344/m.21356 type:complete len:336 (-) Transcript_6344:156-1163(-)